MASLQRRTRANGTTAWIVQFCLNKNRRAVFLSSSYSEKEAKKVHAIVEEIVVSIETGAPLDRRSFAWLSKIPDDLRTRFEAAGLIEKEEDLSLEELFDRYEREELEDKKPTTVRNKRNAARRFFSFADRRAKARSFSRANAGERSMSAAYAATSGDGSTMARPSS